MTLKMLPKTKSFREENGDFKEFDLHKIEKADINFNEGQKETDYLVHDQSVLKMVLKNGCSGWYMYRLTERASMLLCRPVSASWLAEIWAARPDSRVVTLP